MSIFRTMSQIDIRSIQEKKNGFTYLSWAHALRLLKEHAPWAKVIKHTFEVGGALVPYMRDEAGFAYVMVTVDLGEGDVTTEIMPVLNHSNRPISNPNSFEVNAQLQRCMAKAISMATGLGIHLYAGEDVPRPSEAVGGDNSSQQAAQGSGPSDKSTLAGSSHMQNPSGGPQNPMKPLGEAIKTIAELVKACEDMESLKALYNQVQMRLTADERQLFSNRKKEIMSNG